MNHGYLCISRHEGERLFITPPGGPEIEVKVYQIRGNVVRLAIAADRSVSILRSELKLEPDHASA